MCEECHVHLWTTWKSNKKKKGNQTGDRYVCSTLQPEWETTPGIPSIPSHPIALHPVLPLSFPPRQKNSRCPLTHRPIATPGKQTPPTPLPGGGINPPPLERPPLAPAGLRPPLKPPRGPLRAEGPRPGRVKSGFAVRMASSFLRWTAEAVLPGPGLPFPPYPGRPPAGPIMPWWWGPYIDGGPVPPPTEGGEGLQFGLTGRWEMERDHRSRRDDDGDESQYHFHMQVLLLGLIVGIWWWCCGPGHWGYSRLMMVGGEKGRRGADQRNEDRHLRRMRPSRCEGVAEVDVERLASSLCGRNSRQWRIVEPGILTADVSSGSGHSIVEQSYLRCVHSPFLKVGRRSRCQHYPMPECSSLGPVRQEASRDAHPSQWLDQWVLPYSAGRRSGSRHATSAHHSRRRRTVSSTTSPPTWRRRATPETTSGTASGTASGPTSRSIPAAWWAVAASRRPVPSRRSLGGGSSLAAAIPAAPPIAPIAASAGIGFPYWSRLGLLLPIAGLSMLGRPSIAPVGGPCGLIGP
ncbi:hypothetical protein KC364_g58 [Hortaea werneckii]|nr:hypothetical protein KC364_g58 [Hortaea werneckii]